MVFAVVVIVVVCGGSYLGGKAAFTANAVVVGARCDRSGIPGVDLANHSRTLKTMHATWTLCAVVRIQLIGPLAAIPKLMF